MKRPKKKSLNRFRYKIDVMNWIAFRQAFIVSFSFCSIGELVYWFLINPSIEVNSGVMLRVILGIVIIGILAIAINEIKTKKERFISTKNEIIIFVFGVLAFSYILFAYLH